MQSKVAVEVTRADWTAAEETQPRYLDCYLNSDGFRLAAGSPARGAGADAAMLLEMTKRSLPGLEEFAAKEGDAAVDAGAMRYGAPPSVIPRAPEDIEVEPAGFWPLRRSSEL